MSDAVKTVDEILLAIRHAGGRVTPTKRALAHVLSATTDHLSAEEITAAVHRKHPDTNASTVYRNLEELEELGLVVHAHLGRSAAVYHLAGPLHGHFLCSRCGATIEVPSSTFETVVRTARREYDFDVDRHHLAISGVCAHCQ